MRKMLIPLLMAGVLMPAAAYAQREDRGDPSRGERSEQSDSSSDDRPQRAQRSERSNSDAPRVQRMERSDGDAPRVRVQRADRPVGAERSVDGQTIDPVRVRRVDRQQVAEPVQQVRRIERRRDGDNDSLVSAFQRAGREEAARENGVTVVRRNGDGERTRDGRRDGDRRWDGRRDGGHRWSHDWRRDGRYNWYSYRNRYRSLFRLGRYYDPYRYGYRRFSIGFSLWPSYYGSNYWLNDPWQYRLPPAHGPYRWVRYYDDALLVNIYSGEVVDVIHSFFW